MATLIDHATRTVTHGVATRLTELMITSMMSSPHARRLKGTGRERYARASALAAIRRGGRTDAQQELRFDTWDECLTWSAAVGAPEGFTPEDFTPKVKGE